MAPPICTWNESNYPTARLSPASLRSPLGKTVILERSEESPHSSPRRPVHPFLPVLPESVTPKSCGLLFLPAIVVRTRGPHARVRVNVSSGEHCESIHLGSDLRRP